MKHLKRLQVDLPIEVFHYPEELEDGGQRREIEKLGGFIRQVDGVEKEEGAWKVCLFSPIFSSSRPFCEDR